MSSSETTALMHKYSRSDLRVEESVSTTELSTNTIQSDGGRGSGKRIVFVLLATMLMSAGIGVVVWAVLSNSDNTNAPQNQSAASVAELVTTSGIMDHLSAFEALALNADSGSRSIVNEYNSSAEYVENELLKTNAYNIERQYFTSIIYDEVPIDFEVRESANSSWIDYPSVATLKPANGRDVQALRYSGNGDAIVGAVVRVGIGCDAADYANFNAGDVAMVTDELVVGCDFYKKALLAEDAGAVALLAYRRNPSGSLPGSRVRDSDWTPNSRNIIIPCVGISNTLSKVVLDGYDIRVTVNSTLTYAETFNVVATAKVGKSSSQVVVGAHLDSVPEGPGINDNGSGSAVILEMALQFARIGYVPAAGHQLQFIWFGAEEIGLLGSRHYVQDLENTTGLDHIHAMLNFDMLGSPNYGRFVYDGQGCRENAVDGCGTVQRYFEEYFENNGLSYEVLPFSTTGGSDYFPFVRAGLVAGSIAAGAGGIKTAEQRAKFGGISNTMFDSCYHQPCDTTENINEQGLKELSAAAVYATAKVCESFIL